jgi:peroxiredoxin Q/BCP
VELQSRVEEIQRQGLGLVAVSYDEPEVLRTFAASRGITFPLISDRDSAIIKRFGLLNTTVAPGTPSYGIPFPGTFIVDRRGVVRSRHFENAYQERATVASLLVVRGVTPYGPAMSVETAHL